MKKLRIGLAILCLTLSAYTFADSVVIEYNRQIEAEQQRLLHKANEVITFSSDSWGLDVSIRNRNLIFLLCVAGFFFSLWKRTKWLALGAYGLTLLLAYQWVAWAANAILINDLYAPDSPFLLRIATPFDWTLFLLLAVTFIFNAILLAASFQPRTDSPM